MIKKANCSPEEIKKSCKFKITSPRYKKINGKKYANFAIIVIGEYTAYFEDFPLIFTFRSDTRFKTKVKISYTTADTQQPEVIFPNKTIQFERHDVEIVCPVTEIFPDEIHIEMEIEPEYGYPRCIFAIRKNPLCDITPDMAKDIIFPR